MEKIEQFIRSFHPNHLYWILFGSFSRDENKDGSDVDLIVVYDGDVDSRYERIDYMRTPFDVYTFNIEALNRALHRSSKNGRLALVTAVLEGHPSKTDSIHYRQVLRLAKSIKENFKYTNFDGARFHITELMNVLARNRMPPEKNLLAAELYRALISVLVKISGNGVCTGKYAIKILKHNCPEMLIAIDAAFASAIFGEPDKLLRLSGDVLTQIGGALNTGYYLDLNDTSARSS